MSVLNCDKGHKKEKRPLSSSAECSKGIGIIVGIMAVIYFAIAVATGSIR